MIPKRHILLLGSGLMAEAVVIHLLKRKENQIHIASNIVADAKVIADKYPGNLTYSEVDVMKRQSLEPLISASELVISYIPSFLHIHVARLCLELKKNMVTSSYVSKELKELDENVKNADLIFLNEAGLDPGIDHLSTMKVIDEVKENGGKIVEYESWCGGLPSPQFCDNPLGYKFTWSPIGALRALNNDAKFIQFGKQHVTNSKDLLYNIFNVEINPALSFEGYANRDSVSYKETYGLKDAEKVLRGTLRYRGFCTIVAAFKELGLLKDQKPQGSTWVQHLSLLLKDEDSSPLNKGDVPQELRDITGKIVHKTIYNNNQYQDLTNQQKAKKAKTLISAFRFFDLLNPLIGFTKPNLSIIENLVELLEPKLKLKEGETDLIAMQHVFKIEYPNKPTVTRKSSLLMIGDKHGHSSMSKTVGTPAAIGAQLILDKKIQSRGVIIPIEKQIYEPILKELEEVGIRLIQTEQ